jgi:hypothetical protein
MTDIPTTDETNNLIKRVRKASERCYTWAFLPEDEARGPAIVAAIRAALEQTFPDVKFTVHWDTDHVYKVPFATIRWHAPTKRMIDDVLSLIDVRFDQDRGTINGNPGICLQLLDGRRQEASND